MDVAGRPGEERRSALLSIVLGRRGWVTFGDGPGFWHERVFLWPSHACRRARAPDRWIVHIAGGHTYEEDSAIWRE